MAGQAPVSALRPAHSFRSEDFKELWSSVREFILIETLDDGGKPQVAAVVQLVQAFRADEDGAFATVRYVGCQDEYYQWRVDNEMPPQAHHHFCRSTSLRACRSKVGTDGIVHVLKWNPITRQEGERILREWGLSPVHPDPGRDRSRRRRRRESEEGQRSDSRRDGRRNGPTCDTSF